MITAAFLLLQLFSPAILAHPPPNNQDVHVLAQRDVAARTVTVTSTTTTTETTTLTTCPASTDSAPSKTTNSGFAASPSSSPSGEVTQQDCFWMVPDVGAFRNMATYSFDGDSLPDGLTASNYQVKDKANGAPYNHKFSPSNVGVSDGFLTLTVPGGQKSASTISCAEVTTVEDQILYASVRMDAMFSKVPGTCQSQFFYKNDSQEIDIEWLSDPRSQSNNGAGEAIPFWYTNQAVDPGEEATQQAIDSPSDPTADLHEYRIDWTPNWTAFYIDGEQQIVFNDNIPWIPGSWVFNNWANGDPGWSVGPPSQDSVFKIKSITMYYNTSSTTDSC